VSVKLWCPDQNQFVTSPDNLMCGRNRSKCFMSSGATSSACRSVLAEQTGSEGHCRGACRCICVLGGKIDPTCVRDCSKCWTSSAATNICAPVSPKMMISPTLLRSIPVPRIDPKKSLYAYHGNAYNRRPPLGRRTVCKCQEVFTSECLCNVINKVRGLTCGWLIQT